MAIQVLLHRVLVKRDAPEDTEAVKTKKALEKQGLFIPPQVEKDIDKQALRENASMDKGTVVRIGDLAYRDYGIACPIREGDYVTFAKFGGKEIVDPEDGQTYVCLNDEDLVAVLTK